MIFDSYFYKGGFYPEFRNNFKIGWNLASRFKIVLSNTFLIIIEGKSLLPLGCQKILI